MINVGKTVDGAVSFECISFNLERFNATVTVKQSKAMLSLAWEAFNKRGVKR